VTVELTLLLWSLALYALYLGAQTLFYRLQYGVLFAASARDNEAPAGAVLGRADRALRNFMETWPAFVILALIAHLGDPGDPLVFWGAIVWLVGRIVYLPLYLGGVFMARSLVWCAATTGLFLMFFGVLF
jgi:uncharacterized MAPEG superfamily protein